MDLLIFPPGPADAWDLGQVHVAAWRESYRGLLPDAYLAHMSPAAHAARFAHALARPGGPEVILAAADRQGLVGYAGAAVSRRGRPGEGEVQTLYLRRSVQGRGGGRALLAAAARTLADRGARSLIISTLRDNVRARGFYEHLGGAAGAPHAEPGPGGVHVEVTYFWPRIEVLTGG